VGSGEEKRRAQRLVINLPLQVKTDKGDYCNMELVDVSASGMRVVTDDLSMLDHKADFQSQWIEFDLRIIARPAWVEPNPDGKYAIGLEFTQSDDEPYIG
jgi:hypothetical protein